MQDLTAIYITARHIPESFARMIREQLIDSLGEVKQIAIVQPEDIPRSQAQIYRNVLEGAKQAKTDYVAICEDDVLYSPEHFKFRPKPGHWGYNMNSWSIFTWGDVQFTQKPSGRRNLNGLICERRMLIDYLEERFRIWPGEVDINIFGEPGKYDTQLGIEINRYPSEYFYPNPPNIVFSHQANLQFQGLGTRKKVGQIRATEIPYWGSAQEIRDLYA